MSSMRIWKQEVPHNEENVSAQEASALHGARLPEENVHRQRPQSACQPPREGQSEAVRLIAERPSPVCDMERTSSLKKNYEFRRLYYNGKNAAGSRLVLYVRPNRTETNRLGITVGTKLGKAVVRNRVRRRIREIYRLNEARLARGRDLVVVARSRSVDAKFREMEEEFLRLAGKLGLLVES